jgi:electron transfer flavoprotein beta subunit
VEIIVCVKRTREESRRSIINPLDRHALEEALALRERFPGRVTALAMGSPPARRALDEALAMGADEAVFLCDSAFSGADTLSTARALSCGIAQLGHFDLVLCGNESITGATGHVGPQLAVLLRLPHVTCVKKIEVADEGRLLVDRAVEQGHVRLEVRLPAILAVAKGVNHPRLPTVSGIMAAADKEVRVLSAEDVGAEPGTVGLEGSHTRELRLVESRSERKREILGGPPEEAVRRAVARLKELSAI